MTTTTQIYKERSQDIAIKKWCQQKGIAWSYIQEHPYIADVGILLEIKDNFWTRMTEPEKSSWGGYWSSVYKKRKPLKKEKFFNRFEEIIKRIDKQELIMAQQRQKIKALRQGI